MTLISPRLALATPGAGPDPAVVGVGLLAAMAERGLRVQHFRARACPLGMRAIGAITGLPGRHLDAWLMPPAVCRSVFDRGSRSAELAVIEGTIEPPLPRAERIIDPSSCESACRSPGDLRPIAQAIDAPIVVAVPCDRLDHFHLPRLPSGVEAVILDGIEDPRAFSTLRRMVELVCRRPVLGALEAMPKVREALGEARRDDPIDPDLLAALAASLRRFSDIDALIELAGSRPMPTADPSVLPAHPSSPSRRLKVAYAHDEVFGGYFPDTLETLEALGAAFVEFSPLNDGDLPPGVDLVMVGCGFPDRYADRLAENACMTSALRSWVCRGRPLYAEGGGCAYLGRLLRLGDRTVPGVGVLPFVADLLANPERPEPVERRLTQGAWLGPAGTVVRGYHANRWRLLPAPEPDDCPDRSGFLTAERDFCFRRNAVGSLVHLHLAALPQVVSAFAGLGRPGVATPAFGG